MAKEVGTLKMNDFIQESNLYQPSQYKGFVPVHLDGLCSESTSDSGSEEKDFDNEALSSNNPSTNNLGDNCEFNIFDKNGPKLDKFGNNVKLMDKQGNVANQQHALFFNVGDCILASRISISTRCWASNLLSEEGKNATLFIDVFRRKGKLSICRNNRNCGSIHSSCGS
jgi:hypothetical protein